MLNRIRYFFRKARNIIEYSTSLVSTLIVDEVAKRNGTIVMENLRNLKFNTLSNANKNWSARLNLLAYRRLQRKIEYKGYV